MIYLSGVAHSTLEMYPNSFGYIIAQHAGIKAERVKGVTHWAADNDCYARGDTFDLNTYLEWLGNLPKTGECHFATAPDVVGDAQKTLDRSVPTFSAIRRLGLPVAFVAQDGIEHTAIPWEMFDAIFIGGTNNFKGSPIVSDLVMTAKEKGKWAHMGRVNSLHRCRVAAMIGCDSVDGTFLRFGPDTNISKLVGWFVA